MDRGIERHFRDYRNLLAAVSAIGLGIAVSEQAFSQQRPRFQMPSPEEMFRTNDKNGDGRLDSNEINANPFLPRMLERSGIDTSRDISERDFIDSMDQARRNWEQNGGRNRGGPGEGERGGPEGERGQDWRRRREEGEDGQRGRDESEENAENRDREERDARSTERRERRDTEREPRPRVTLDLQDDLVDGDTDGDGQIAFFEWRHWEGKKLSEFHELDLNADGYVTPREVEAIRGPTEEEKKETQVATADRRSSRTRDADSEESGDDKADGDDERSQANDDGDRRGSDRDAAEQSDDNEDQRRDGRQDEESRSSRRDDRQRDEEEDRGSDESPDEARAAAQRYFRLLDRDRDGEVAADEWQGGRIRGMFEDDGIDLDESMSEDDFIDNYVRLSADGG